MFLSVVTFSTIFFEFGEANCLVIISRFKKIVLILYDSELFREATERSTHKKEFKKGDLKREKTWLPGNKKRKNER